VKELNIEQERREFEALVQNKNANFEQYSGYGAYKNRDTENVFQGYLLAKRAATPAITLDADALAQEIRRVDGNHSLGAGALAEALMLFIERAAMGSAEPVAWRYKPKDGLKHPAYTERFAQALAYDADPVPLYTAPPASVSAEPVAPPEGQQISVDVSTGDDDAGHRIFARLTGEFGNNVWYAEMTENNAPPSADAKDSERLNFLIEKQASVRNDYDPDEAEYPTLYWLEYPCLNDSGGWDVWVQIDEHKTAREAIDAAIAAKESA
jgi:hypothetical protein